MEALNILITLGVVAAMVASYALGWWARGKFDALFR